MVKKFIIILLCLLLELTLIEFVQLYIPNANVVIELNEDNILKHAWICEKDNVKELSFQEESPDEWLLFINNCYFNIEDQYKINTNNKTAISVKNTVPARLLILDPIIGNSDSSYKNIWNLIIYNNLFSQFFMFGLCNVILISIIFIILRKHLHIVDLFSNLIYDLSVLKAVGKAPIACSIILSIISIIIKPGCDYEPISRAIATNLSGIDIYQLQYIYEIHVLDRSFVTWPYNPIMLLFYSVAGIFSLKYYPFYLKTTFDIFPAILLKITNIILLNATVLGIIGFLSDQKIIKNDNIKKIYLWSIFNPLVFYISIIFIQLDVFPMYCICLGILLLCKINFKIQNGIISAILLACGISCKLQNILIIPPLFLFLFMVMLHNRKKIYVIFLFLTLSATFLSNVFVTNSIIHALINSAKQAERIWYSIFTLAPNVHIYITFFVLIFIFLINVFMYHSQITSCTLIYNTLFMIGEITLAFSFSMLSTPSTLIYVFPSFVLLMALENDWIKRIMINFFSVLCVSDVMFTSIGDITASLNYIGKTGIFTTITLLNSPESIQFTSILTTISKAGMFAYTLLFYKYGHRLLSKNKL